jgi:hypothetical protein
VPTGSQVQFIVGQLDRACRVLRQLRLFLRAQIGPEFRIFPSTDNAVLQHGFPSSESEACTTLGWHGYDVISQPSATS